MGKKFKKAIILFIIIQFLLIILHNYFFINHTIIFVHKKIDMNYFTMYNFTRIGCENMKKVIVQILLFMMLIPLLVNAENCDVNKISISSIEIEKKSDNVEEIEEANTNKRIINLNLSMSKIGDAIKYKIIVKNESDDDFELDKNNFIIDSEYIDYSLETDDNSHIIKANSSKAIYLNVKYINEVPEESFKNGSYESEKTITIQLSNDNTIINPKTLTPIYIILIIVSLLTIMVRYLIRKKCKSIALIIILSIIIPVNTLALCKSDIKIVSKIKITKKSTPQVFSFDIRNNEIVITEYKKDLAMKNINYQIDDVNKCETYFADLLLSINNSYYNSYNSYTEGLYDDESAEVSSKKLCLGLNDKYSWTLENYIYSGLISNNDYLEAGISNVSITNKTDSSELDVIVPNQIMEYPVTSLEGMVFSYMDINSVVLPDSIISISGYDDGGTFMNNNLKNIVLPKNLEYIGPWTFIGNKLEEVIIPDRVTTIGEGAFANNKISVLDLGSSVETISYAAFSNNNLTAVTIPASVQWIGPRSVSYTYFDAAFNNNPLSSVIIEGKSSASEFIRYGNKINGVYYTPFSWDENVTCIKDNDENIENGCITWKGNN